MIWKELLNLVIVLAFCWFVLMLAGCASKSIYDYTRTDHPDGTTTHELYIETAAEHPDGIGIKYNREEGLLEITSAGIDRTASIRQAASFLEALANAYALPTVPE